MTAKKKTVGTPRTRAAVRGRALFVDPGPSPRWDHEPADEAERVRWTNELYDWQIRSMIYQATHFNDPRMRTLLASRLAWGLLADHPVRRPVREYLAWVLNTLSDAGALPHMGRGNAIKTDQRLALVRELVDIMRAQPDGPIVKRLEAAAAELKISFSKVRELYYSDSYKSWETLSR